MNKRNYNEQRMLIDKIIDDETNHQTDYMTDVETYQVIARHFDTDEESSDGTCI